MPADRHIPVTPRKGGPYIRLPPVDSPEDSRPKNTEVLPSFSELLATLGLLSPASTPQTPAFPSFRVVTPPSSIRTPSSCATRFPVSPLSPTPYSEPPRSTLSQTSFFQDQRSIHRRGDASPSKDYVPLGPGLPMTDSLKDHEADLRSAGPIAESGTRSSDLLECGWSDCDWIEYPKKHLPWSQHLNWHFDQALTSEKKKDGRATCRWKTCTSRIGKGASWKRHVREHDLRFFFFCPHCFNKYVTDQKLRDHLKDARCKWERRSLAGYA